jgi:hypothetical protein
MLRRSVCAALATIAIGWADRGDAQNQPPVSAVGPLTGGNAFDGTWAANLVCLASGGAQKGYTLNYNLEVTNGVMHGQFGPPGTPGAQTFNGEIHPDGGASIRGSGVTGDSAYNVGGVAAGIPFNYSITAHFDGTRGTGNRTDGRPCTLTATKRASKGMTDPGLFDGRWIGQSIRCSPVTTGKGDFTGITVNHAHFNLATNNYSGRWNCSVDIRPDGSFENKTCPMLVSGKFSGNKVEIRFSTDKQICDAYAVRG